MNSKINCGGANEEKWRSPKIFAGRLPQSGKGEVEKSQHEDSGDGDLKKTQKKGREKREGPEL